MRVYTPLLFVFLVLGPSSINGDTDPNDASALRVMYQSLNSPGQLTKWTANGGDPCGENWKGVTCSGSRVTEINIPSLGLSGNLGYQLTSLTSLNSFDISNNNLGNQLPYNLPPILQRLNIARCGFSGSLPYYISLMKPLKYLNAAHNQLNGELTDMFSTLPSLSTLDLSFNSLTGELPESFSSLSSATNMYLQNNQFTGTIDVLDLGKSETHGTPAMHPHRHLVHLHLEAAIGTANQVETTTTTRPPVTQVVVERNPASMVELSPES